MKSSTAAELCEAFSITAFAIYRNVFEPNIPTSKAIDTTKKEGSFPSIMTVMLAMNEEVLRNTHLKARSILDFANISRAERHPYILGSSGDCELDLSGLLFKCCARQDERKNGLGGMDDHHDENRALANGKHACMDVIVSFVISVCMIIASFLFVPSPSIQLVHGIDQHDKRASLHCEID